MLDYEGIQTTVGQVDDAGFALKRQRNSLEDQKDACGLPIERAQLVTISCSAASRSVWGRAEDGRKCYEGIRKC